jgi:Cd2+/Zn2+-exporting ATPase
MKLPWSDKKFVLLIVVVVAVIALEIFSITGVNLPTPYAPFVFGAFILGVGYKVLWEGLQALVRFKFSSINLLMLIAVVAAFYLGEYPEAAVVIVLYVLGEKLEDIGVEQSMSALDKLVENSPKTATLKSTGESIPVIEIEVGTVIQVKPHDLIPLDGEVVFGDSAVDESTITGEPIPKDKIKGDSVFAGTLNKSGFIEIRVTRAASDSTLAKIIELTFEAQAAKSKSQKFIQRFAKIYTPIVLLLVAMLLAVPVLFFDKELNDALMQAITLLVISCPCALVISTPVAIYAAIGNVSARGALIKGGMYLEEIAKTKAICLDKTRTITYGKPIVSDVISVDGTEREELLACTAGTELFSEHPLAQAIVDAAKREGFTPHESENFESHAGKGAQAYCKVCEGEEVFVGSLNFVREHQPVSKEAEKVVAKLSAEGKTSVVISFGHGVAGIIGLTDEVKPDSAQAIDEMKEIGLEPVMLTGDNNSAAQFVAQHVGIAQAYGDLLPQDKVKRLKDALIKYGHVVMVGDGVNDAPALALSSVGVAMGAAGSDTAIETANIALMNDKLSLIPFLVKLGRRTVTVIKGNTIGAIAVKLLFIALAFAGYSNLVLAITADVGVTLVVILISLTLSKYKGKIDVDLQRR